MAHKYPLLSIQHYNQVNVFNVIFRVITEIRNYGRRLRYVYFLSNMTIILLFEDVHSYICELIIDTNNRMHWNMCSDSTLQTLYGELTNTWSRLMHGWSIEYWRGYYSDYTIRFTKKKRRVEVSYSEKTNSQLRRSYTIFKRKYNVCIVGEYCIEKTRFITVKPENIIQTECLNNDR